MLFFGLPEEDLESSIDAVSREVRHWRRMGIGRRSLTFAETTGGFMRIGSGPTTLNSSVFCNKLGAIKVPLLFVFPTLDFWILKTSAEVLSN